MVRLRERQWRRHILAPDCMPVPAALSYARSAEWADLEAVFRADWTRRPRGSGVAFADARWVILRAAVLNRYGRYVQGYLYLALPILSVVRARHVALYAFVRVVAATTCYGPAGMELGFGPHRRAVAEHVLLLAAAMAPHNGHKVRHLRRSLGWSDNLCLKLLFIALGQRFTFSALLCVWDFALPDMLNGGQARLHACAAAVIALYVRDAPMKADANEYAEGLWGILTPPLGESAAAAVVALAAQSV